MGKAHSTDLRVRVYEAIADGVTRRGEVVLLFWTG